MAQLVLPLETGPGLRREDFVVGAGNREAVAFLDAYPDWPATAAAIHGPAQSGKSHLAASWAERAGGDIVDAASVDASILEHDRPAVVENVDAVPPEAGREAVLFTLIERHAPVLFTARVPPPLWPVASPDLATRYRALLTFGLWAPDDALLAGLARKLFADRQLIVPDAVVAEMVRSLERSPVAIRDFVAYADAKALSRKRPVTLGLVRELLSTA